MPAIQPAPRRPLLAKIFISPDEPRLRAGWRLLLQTILMVLITVVLGVIFYFLQPKSPSETTGLLLNEILELLVFTSSIFVARRYLDKRTFGSLGFGINLRTLADVFAGIVITFLMMGLIFITESATGWLRFESFAWQIDPIGIVAGNLLAFLVIFVLTGVNEEMLSRGYHLQTIASGLNMFWAVLISSSVFGLAHLGNPNATWVSAAGIFFAGVFLAYGYVRTGQLWLSIGLHIGWNFFEGVIFGFPVSGIATYRLLQIQIHGPELWTGGAFGPEAGLVIIPALIFGSILIYFYTRFRISST
jgi:uncharacterized protein